MSMELAVEQPKEVHQECQWLLTSCFGCQVESVNKSDILLEAVQHNSSLSMLVRAVLLDKKPDEVPISYRKRIPILVLLVVSTRE
ncbi:hypothetical protein L6452_40404 [Arctium lappa]|uniref:Uncharacterized protein n=1 Tax=Arctium lappa TaxID=4217 RepID=A0ACB8XM62_ARCLA|nr:hypothetical protein L6452_40404 [Arctium lappa]